MSWLKKIFKADRNLIKKNFLLLSILVVSLFAMTFISFFSVNEWRKSLKLVYLENVLPTEKITTIVHNVEDIRFRLLAFIADVAPAAVTKRNIREDIEAVNLEMANFSELIKNSKLNAEDKELIEKFKTAKLDVEKFSLSALGELEKENKEKIIELVENDWPQIITTFLKPIKKYQGFQSKNVEKTYSDVSKKVLTFIYVIFIIFLTLVLVLLYSIYFIKQFKIQSNEAIDNLKNVEAALFVNSTNAKSASDKLIEITNSNRQSVVETSASLEEITTMVKNTSDHARQSSDFAISTTHVAERGMGVVVNLLNSIEIINSTITNIINEMQGMDSNLKKIESIFAEVENKTKVINDIVFQTKLLSFNASVEAARAGEHGKGFSIVAEEVGNLAQMSGKAAAEISDLITNGGREISTIVSMSKVNLSQLSKEAEASIKDGNDNAQECNISFQNISTSLIQIQSSIQELSKGSSEQTLGVSEVNKAMHFIGQATEEGASVSVQTQAISGHVSLEANHLKQTVDHLVRIFNG